MPTRVCLVSIVKNEQHIIERCLNSALGIIDYISICDTGSTDNTVQVIRDWGAKNNIPTSVHTDGTEFVNFGHNRTQAYNMSRQSYPDADYCLFLDADMVITANNFNANILTEPSYHVYHIGRDMKYTRLFFAATRISWKSVGVTHEYWQSTPKTVSATLDENVFQYTDKGDGGCNPNKFLMDIRLLKAGLEQETDPGLLTRYKFYMANTYKKYG